MYNLTYKGIKLNSKPLTAEQAKFEIGIIIMNYGYRPEMTSI
jgi:hypothetical protein